MEAPGGRGPLGAGEEHCGAGRGDRPAGGSWLQQQERTLHLVPCDLPSPESARKTVMGMNESQETEAMGGKPVALKR